MVWNQILLLFRAPKKSAFLGVQKYRFSLWACIAQGLSDQMPNATAFLGAQKYRSFGCPKIPLFYLGLKSLGGLGSNTASFYGA